MLLIEALQLYSMTKLVTTVSVLQLVDRGLLDLDDPAIVEKHLPELWSQPIMRFRETDAEPTFTARTVPLTLKHLLTHTSGLSYFFNTPEITRWEKHVGRRTESLWSGTVEGFVQPLIFEPGTQWRYSIGIDWAGILVERVSGEDLETYFAKHIFEPLGIKNITFVPTPEVQDRLQKVCTRDGDRIVHTESMRSITNPSLGQLSGGGGLFGTARDYLRFLRGLLASGVPGAEGTILSQKAFKTLFTDALPPRGQGVHAGLAEMTTRQTYHDPEHTANDAQYLGHSVGLVLNVRDSVNGRKAGSGCWDGAARTQYWLDPTTGVAVSVKTSVHTTDQPGHCVHPHAHPPPRAIHESVQCF
jgi:CubicO group peptidase (beta-lactamase class C family)